MKINSRSKGKRGELEWSKWMNREWGFNSCRGQQRSGNEEQDVLDHIDGTICEVKRCEQVRLTQWMEKLIKDKTEQEKKQGVKLLPWIAHRRNKEEWLVTVRARDLVSIARKLCEQVGR
jgi:hypothetical protein